MFIEPKMHCKKKEEKCLLTYAMNLYYIMCCIYKVPKKKHVVVPMHIKIWYTLILYMLIVVLVLY